MNIHARCLAVRAEDGYTLICGKGQAHADSRDPERREHYDPDFNERWTDEEQQR